MAGIFVALGFAMLLHLTQINCSRVLKDATSPENRFPTLYPKSFTFDLKIFPKMIVCKSSYV